MLVAVKREDRVSGVALGHHKGKQKDHRGKKESNVAR